ncbi:MAG: hypothetical protein KGI78_00070 [Patescibacteria group bacterium]|nr:hypothetical protein [Patescibacteria group bacterium]MDE1944780.1 hypothetical protein [Patescibacteria group bacterium]MDE2057233.1 hypothetical protein [Patescibacteria group bacterium]
MPPTSDGEKSALEEERERLYAAAPPAAAKPSRFAAAVRRLPHAWAGVAKPLASVAPPTVTERHVKLATYFFIGAITFFGLALVLAAYLIYFGGDSVSVDNITIQVEGPTTIAAGDTVPLTIAVTNRNPVDLENATLEADFPPGTRSATDVSSPFVAYNDALGTIKSGETVTSAVKAVVFGSAGDTLAIPIALSYGTKGSNSTFVKKYSYPLKVSSTPLSISVDTIAQTTAGKPFTITLEARSNATVPLDNVVVEGAFPFGFKLTSSSLPAQGTDIPLGTLAPGDAKTVTLTGTLDGQNGQSEAFHFSIGTASQGGGLGVSYMTQDATVAITAPFLETDLALNGAPVSSATLAPASTENVTVSYTNTLSTQVNDATISVEVSGGAVDYSSIRATNGFYDSSTHTITFSKDQDVALATLAPGASGVGSFVFSTVPASSFGRAPSVTFTTSVAGSVPGDNNAAVSVAASKTDTIKAATAVELSVSALHAAGPFANTGPIPPSAGAPTTYTIQWTAADGGGAVAGAAVTATLPAYVDYTGKTSGQGSFSYDPQSRVVTWTAGDLAAGSAATGYFQVSFTPSTSQRGASPALVGPASFTAFDRFAGVNISASADAVTTETPGDPGYNPAKAEVQ